MANKNASGEINPREWLVYHHNGKDGAFAFPPTRGHYRDCYQTMKLDRELVPAEGLNLALLVQGAYTKETPRWQKIKIDCFVKGYLIAPMRTLWIPHDDDLAGIILERDLEGEGMLTSLEGEGIPTSMRSQKNRLKENISSWTKGENGIYESPDKNLILVPEGSYNFGVHSASSFVKDGFVTAVFTAEGAEMLVKTAVDAKLKLLTWGYEVMSLTEPKWRIVDFNVDNDRFNLAGYNWGDSWEYYAFGISRTGEDIPQKN